MSARTIDNPGIELNEIDRSNYGKVDNSLPNSPTSFVIGFADKGQDMTLEWIDSKSTLDETFGQPSTEFEAYMYNAAVEVLNRGGSCIASKLPYDNNQRNKYNYIDFNISNYQTMKPLDGDTNFQTIGDIHDSLEDVLEYLGIYKNINTIAGMANAIVDLYNRCIGPLPEELSQIEDLSCSLAQIIRNGLTQCEFASIYFNDSSLTSYIKIEAKPSSENSNEYGGMFDIRDFDDLITSQKTVQRGTMRIVDITKAQYQSVQNYNCVSSEALSSYTNDCLGIIPVIVTPANAMYFQNLLDFNKDIDVTYDFTMFNSVSSYAVQHHSGIVQDFSDIDSHVSIPIASTPMLPNASILDIDSVSRTATNYFPPINFYDAEHFDKTNLKKIGVVVFKAFKDTSNSGKIGFQVLESFIGSLDRNAKDQLTNANIFIDNIVNQNSQFIRLFSNADPQLLSRASLFATSRQPAVSLGFFREDCEKNISFYNSVMTPLTQILDKASNPNIVPLDIVVDAGVSNIAQLAKISTVAQSKAGLGTDFDYTKLHTEMFSSIGDYYWPFDAVDSDISGWRACIKMFDDFCKSIRKDCMFIADGLRPVCIDGNSKIVRPTAPSNTVANSIIPKFRQIAHTIDSSYSAGYCNWFYQQDYSHPSNYFWCPPSIKAMGVYTYCDTYFHPWSAPAGIVRGVIGDAVDVAFLPTESDAGIIYSNSWNYAMSYPIDGIVIEGHKTFQTQRTALDRINVRRLMLSLEKQVAAIARNFVYEQNTAYTRQQFVDSIEPILESAVSGDGISDYAVKCDEELNTQQVIDNNEMRCKIAVKPVKVVDWIVIDFICTNQSANVNEEVVR